MSASGRREPRVAAQSNAAATDDPATAAPQSAVQDAKPHAAPPPVEVPDVARAVSLAIDRFPEQLAFALNSKSDRETPFENPTACWQALEWLATMYRDSRLGNVSEPDFNHSLHEACGWEYTAHQSETAMNKYPEDYTARVDGKTYQLREHIGKGSNKDPRYTIRIAFAWDKDLEVVVIGYIGQHQRTDST